MKLKELISRYPMATCCLFFLVVLTGGMAVVLKPHNTRSAHAPENTQRPDASLKGQAATAQILPAVKNTGRKKISGQIFDTTDLIPVPGVNIVSGKGNSVTTTHADGHFAMMVEPYEKALKISFVGFEPKELILDERDRYVVGITPENNELK